MPLRFATLGHPQRLAIFRLLMRRHPDALPAGEIAAVLGVKSSTLSAYLSALMQAGLITQTRIGTSRCYGIALPALRETLGYLAFDCCRGRADLCAPLLEPFPAPAQSTGTRPMNDRQYNVLFLCTGNSARSIFAESILRRLGGDRFNVFSAGTKPYSEVNPFALKVLRAKGHDTSVLRAKKVAEFQGADAPVMDFVFTVCDRAANEDCPAWQGQPVSAHWGMPDPVKTEGTDARKRLAIQQAYRTVHKRITAFTALPIGTLDKISLQNAVDDLGREAAGNPA